MVESTNEKLLAKLTEQYEEAAKNPNVRKIQVRNLYFELNILRTELAKMNEEELKQVDKMYNEVAS